MEEPNLLLIFPRLTMKISTNNDGGDDDGLKSTGLAKFVKNMSIFGGGDKVEGGLSREGFLGLV
ncbi:hypothetical protein PanWU01x14_130640 [Parasponia andersonii]|uniref:Uncharacterized protein n=1 Tax=Parasponia andersonii TaxID=3476 RepID=A0A2P5CRA8_PARAD|nr:hypothetical protein PanWU01x14_130640 [Parasponia andersonii]